MKRALDPRRGSMVLLLALVPMLGYFGHWSLPIPRPASGSAESSHVHEHGHAISQDASHSHDDSAAADDDGPGHSHGQHCHGESANCSDVPYTGSATVALLAMSIEHIGRDASGWAVPGAVEASPYGFSPGVEPHPPREPFV